MTTPTRRPGRRRASERGASVVEYALLTALFVIGLIAAADTLVDESGDALAANSSQIGDARPYRIALVSTTTPPPAAWAITTVPDNGFTLYDTMVIATGPEEYAGYCWNFERRTVELMECVDDGELIEPELEQLYSIEHYQDSWFRITVAVTNECLVAKGAAGQPILPKECDTTPDQLWELDKLGPYTFGFKSSDSGLCADVTDGRLEEAACTGESSQIFSIGGGA